MTSDSPHKRQPLVGAETYTHLKSHTRVGKGVGSEQPASNLLNTSLMVVIVNNSEVLGKRRVNVELDSVATTANGEVVGSARNSACRRRLVEGGTVEKSVGTLALAAVRYTSILPSGVITEAHTSLDGHVIRSVGERRKGSASSALLDTGSAGGRPNRRERENLRSEAAVELGDRRVEDHKSESVRAAADGGRVTGTGHSTSIRSLGEGCAVVQDGGAVAL